MRLLYLMEGSSSRLKREAVERAGIPSDLYLDSEDLFKNFGINVPSFEGPVTRLHSKSMQSIVNDLWEAVLVERMLIGATIFASNNDFPHSRYHELAKLYHYSVVVANTQIGRTQEECIDGEADEELKNQKRIYNRTENSKFYANPPIISSDEIADYGFQETVEIPEDMRIVLVGDVQSCSVPLSKLVEKYNSESTLFIFCGDLFDRGTDPIGVLNLVDGLFNQPVLVEGNHDLYLRWLVEGIGVEKPQAVETMDIFKSRRISNKKLRKSVLRHLVPFYDFSYCGKRYLVTHGGIDVNQFQGVFESDGVHTNPIVEESFIYGAGSATTASKGVGYYTEDIDEHLTAGPFFDAQFHGHRNEGLKPTNYVPGIYNLESGVEYDGYLTAVVLDGKDSLEIEHIEN